MPHLVIDYSEDLEQRIEPLDLVGSTYNGALKSGHFDKGAIKVRARAFKDHIMGGEKKDFVSVTIFLLSGRTVQQKHDLTHIILEEIKTLNITDASLTVQIYDMERETYAKSIV